MSGEEERRQKSALTLNNGELRLQPPPCGEKKSDRSVLPSHTQPYPAIATDWDIIGTFTLLAR